MRVVFVPVAMIDTSSLEVALVMANDSNLGPLGRVLTKDLEGVIEPGKTLEFGGIVVNEVPSSAPIRCLRRREDAATPVMARPSPV